MLCCSVGRLITQPSGVYSAKKDEAVLRGAICTSRTSRTIAIRFDPFWMLLAQGVVSLMLKLNARANFARLLPDVFIFIFDDIGNRQIVATARP